MIDDDVFDVASERAEAQIDAFIERRSKEFEEANKEQRMLEEWNRLERARTAKRREENRRTTIANLGHLHRVYLGHAARVADERSRLLLEGGHEPEETPGPEAA